jgi:hypothetical protein
MSPGDRFGDLHVVLALELEQMAHLERLLAIVDEQLRVLLHRALVDAEDAELADEGIVDDLEDVGDDVRLRIRRGVERGGFFARALHERWRIGFARMRQQAPGNLQQVRQAGAAARGHEAHRHEMAFAQALFERIVQFLAGESVFAEVEVVVHHRLVHFDHLVEDLLVPIGDGAEIGVAFGDLAAVTEAVDDALSVVGGQVEWQQLRAEGFAQVVQHARRVCVVVVDLVDDDDPAQVARLRVLHHAARAVFHAGIGVDDDRDGFHRGERRERRPAEIRVSGCIDQVDVDGRVVGQRIDARDRRIDRVPAFLFDRIEIGNRRAALDGACRLDRAAGMQQGFEEHGFAGAWVACEGHVADVFGRIGHEAVSPVLGIRGPSWLSASEALPPERLARRAVMAGTGVAAGRPISRRPKGRSSIAMYTPTGVARSRLAIPHRRAPSWRSRGMQARIGKAT